MIQIGWVIDCGVGKLWRGVHYGSQAQQALGEEEYWVGKLFKPQKAWLRSGPAPETLLDRFTAWTIPK